MLEFLTNKTSKGALLTNHEFSLLIISLVLCLALQVGRFRKRKNDILPSFFGGLHSHLTLIFEKNNSLKVV